MKILSNQRWRIYWKKNSSFRSPRNAESTSYKKLINVAGHFFVSTVVWSQALVWSNYVYGRKKTPFHIIFFTVNFLAVIFPNDKKSVHRKILSRKFPCGETFSRQQVAAAKYSLGKLPSQRYVLTTRIYKVKSLTAKHLVSNLMQDALVTMVKLL